MIFLYYFCAFIYSVVTALRIISEKSVGKLSPFPFASLLTNSFIWSLYGLLTKDPTVLLPNCSGVLTGLYCFCAFVNNSAASSKIVISCSILLMLLAILLFVQNNVTTLGSFGCILAVILMGSPLASLMTVIREKSTDSMPFYTSFLTWCNAFSWSLYGAVVAHDKMVREKLT